MEVHFKKERKKWMKWFSKSIIASVCWRSLLARMTAEWQQKEPATSGEEGRNRRWKQWWREKKGGIAAKVESNVKPFFFFFKFVYKLQVSRELKGRERERERETWRIIDGSNTRDVPKQWDTTQLHQGCFYEKTSELKHLKWRRGRDWAGNLFIHLPSKRWSKLHS